MSNGIARDRVGIVFIAVDVELDHSTIVYVGYWDSGHSVLEQMPIMSKASDAIRWGLERTDDVRIRVDDHQYFWAGSGPRPQRDPQIGGTIMLDSEDEPSAARP